MTDVTKVDSALTELLGRLCMRWAYAEAMLGEVLAHLIEGQPAMFHIVASNVSAKSIADWIRAIHPMRVSHPNSQAGLQRLLIEIDDARAERNELVHGLWEPHEPQTALVQTVKLDRAEVIKTRLVTTADLEELIAHTNGIVVELRTIINWLRKERGMELLSINKI